jgi:hypothetical protein
MARGESGRIVIEVDPTLKRELYAALALSGSTLKGWFVRSAEAYCGSAHQVGLFEEPSPAEEAVAHVTEAYSK